MEQDLGGGIKLTTKYLTRPITVLGYKLSSRARYSARRTTMSRTATSSTSPHDPSYNPEAVREGALAAKEENDKVEVFFAGADVQVHDSQYTDKEYLKDKKGWGHSSFEWAIKSAHRARVKRLVLFHHDPERSDDKLEELYNGYVSKIKGQTTMRVSSPRKAQASKCNSIENCILSSGGPRETNPADFCGMTFSSW